MYNFDEFLIFIKKNALQLQNIRCDPNNIILNVLKDDTKLIPYFVNNDNFQWNGFFLNNKDKEMLKSFINSFKNLTGVMGFDTQLTFYCDHITQFYIQKKNKNELEKINKIPKFTKVLADIDMMIIRQSDNAIVFNVKNISSEYDNEIFVSSNIPHITGMLPRNIKPVESLSILLDYKNNPQSEKYIKVECDFSLTCTCLQIN
jgi:hypothetical protein